MQFPFWPKATNVQLHGSYDDSFTPLIQAFKQIQPQAREDSQPGGSALAVYFQGKKVVDVWTGLMKQDTPWQQDSMALSFSTGKAALATLVHRLADQGLLDYDQKIAHYWPEFGKNGKGDITIRHVLAHQSGLFDIRQNIQSAVQMLDWHDMLKVYENATPRFEPGTKVAYQALSFGWLLGGVVEKLTGQSVCEVFQNELVTPLGLDGAYFGVPAAELERVARPIVAVSPDQTANQQKVKPAAQKNVLPKGRRPLTLQEKMIKLTGLDPYEAEDALMPKGISRFSFFTDRVLQACIPAANGVFTARSLAKMYAMLVNQGISDGQQYLSPERVRLLSQIQNTQRDRIMSIPMNWRLGYHRILSLGKRVPEGFGHIGYNGSGAWCDPLRGLSFAYVHNFAGSSITGDPRLWWLTQTALQNADLNLTGKKGWF